MERYTRHIDKFECRIENCGAEDWIKDVTGFWPDNDFCESCPFMEALNQLAKYEDIAECLEDDLK